MDAKEIERRFTYDTRTTEQAAMLVRAAYVEFATRLVNGLPEGREKSLAFTALEESSFWARAAVAREGK